MELDFEAPTHAVPEDLGIDAGLGTQHNAFTNRQADSPAHQVVRQLDHRSRSQWTYIYDGIAERIEDRLYFLVRFEISRRQYLQASVGDSIFTDDQWRIHDPRSAQTELGF